MLIDGKQMHLHIQPGDIGRYVILPGDPGRCESIAKWFDSPRLLASNREYTIWTGYLLGEPVAVCSTGIGGPSAAIAVEELIECGADTFIRVGTSGGIDHNVRGGDVVVAMSAVRQEGTTREYMPIEYPATADYHVVAALAEASQKLEYRHHIGVVQSKDSFYGECRPMAQPIMPELVYKWEAWKSAGVLTSEMECAAIFVVGAVNNARCGAVLNVIWNADIDTEPMSSPEMAERGVRVAIEALKILIEKDRKG